MMMTITMTGGGDGGALVQVAESLLNPFGEDDDNFEINSLIDSLLKVLTCLSACLTDWLLYLMT